ncbi:MAG: type II secretion system F family protein [Verrucomicrobiota bacterium]
MTLRQRIRFYQQLAVLVRAGLPLRASVDRLKAQLGAGEVTVLSERLHAGDRLGESFAAAQFLPFETDLVAAGERSAQLDTVFDQLSEFWKRELTLRQAMVSPLVYPIVVLHIALVLGAAVELFETAWPIVAVHFALRLAAFYAVGLLLYGLARYTWTSPAFRRMWLFTPLIGRALRSACAYRWITALRLEFTAGISLYRAVGDAWRASGYAGGERIAGEAEAAMRSGESLSTLVRQWRSLPRDWIDFIETAEVSGAFEQAFRNLEAEAAREWDLAQQRLAEWLPKILYFAALIVVAVQVGSVLYQVEVAPIEQVEKAIDDASQGK